MTEKVASENREKIIKVRNGSGKVIGWYRDSSMGSESFISGNLIKELKRFHTDITKNMDGIRSLLICR